MHNDAVVIHFAILCPLRSTKADVEDVCIRILVDHHARDREFHELRHDRENTRHVLFPQVSYGHTL
jgi:hypothetical protein